MAARTQSTGPAPAAASSSPPPARASGSLFPPIPAPLQRLFDLVPLVTYPANVLPGDDGEAGSLPTLYVFISPEDAARGLASFNPTCLKWQAFLRFSGVPVRLAPSSNHASPTGALPFLQPARPQQPAPSQLLPSRRPLSPPPPPPLPVPAHNLPSYVATAAGPSPAAAVATTPVGTLSGLPPRAAAYQALLDTSLRRAWLHAVYLDDDDDDDGDGHSTTAIATRLYAHAASASPLVRSVLAHQLRAAAAAEVWGATRRGSSRQPTAAAMDQLYTDAEVALSALATLLGENDGLDGEDGDGNHYFFNRREPTVFDAAVFSYTHLLLEDANADTAASAGQQDRFYWQSRRRLPDLVRAQPRLVQHRARIVARYWPSAGSPATGSVADSVYWVKV